MRNTIKKHSDFLMPEDCPTFRTDFFIAKCNKTKFQGDARYGLVATKKTFKLAVNRNRVKRLLRVWIAKNHDLLNPNMDYIFIARSNILNADADLGIKTMKLALEKLSK